MSKFHNFFGFWLCIIMIGGILGFSGNGVFAKITLTEQPGEIPDKPTVVIKFDEREDICELDEALGQVLEPLKKHSGTAMCPYEFLRSTFVTSFESKTKICFCGNGDLQVRKICEIFTDMILKRGNIFNCDSLLLISLDYVKSIADFYDYIITVVKDALEANVSELRAVYDVHEGYKLVI